MAITQEMKNVVRDIKIETISDFGTFQELESFAKELLSSNDTGNKLLALRIQNRLNENPNYQTFINRQKIEEAQIAEQKEKEIDKTQHLRQQNATVNVENRKRTENNEKIKENERKILDNINYKSIESVKYFLQHEFMNMSTTATTQFFHNYKEELDKMEPKDAAEHAFKSLKDNTEIINKKSLDNVKGYADDLAKGDFEAFNEKYESQKSMLSVANIATASQEAGFDFVEFFKENVDRESAMATQLEAVQGKIEGVDPEIAKTWFYDDGGGKIYVKKDAPPEAKEQYEIFLREKAKNTWELLEGYKDLLQERGLNPNKILANTITDTVEEKVKEYSTMFSDPNTKQSALNHPKEISNLIYRISGLDNKSEILLESLNKLSDNADYVKLLKYHKTEIYQMLLSKDDNIDSVAKDNFIRELYESENHYALKAFLKSFPNNEFGNDKSIDLIVQKLGEQYQRIDRIEEKTKTFLNGQDINDVNPKNINDPEIKRYIELEQSINNKNVQKLKTDLHLSLTQSLANTYNQYFDNPEHIEQYIENSKNNSNFFNEQELRQLQEVSRAEFYVVLRELVIEKIKQDPEWKDKQKHDINEWSIAEYLIQHDKNFANSEYGKNAIQYEEDKKNKLEQNQIQEQEKNTNTNQVYNPTVRGQGQTEGVAYEAQVLIEKNYRVMPNDSQVFIPNGNSGLL